MHQKATPKTPTCKICKAPLVRIERDLLMKLIPASKHYRCPACQTHFFRCLGFMQRC